MAANYFKRFISTRKIAYYVACGVALLALIGGIVAAATLKEAGISVLAWVLPLIGLAAFLAMSILGYERVGICVVGVMSFFAFVTTLIEVFGYFLAAIQDQAMTGFNIAEINGLSALIASAVLLIVSAIAGNVLAYLNLTSCRPLELVRELTGKAKAVDTEQEQNASREKEETASREESESEKKEEDDDDDEE